MHINTGVVSGGTRNGTPILGNNIIIGFGAVVLGDTHIADGVAAVPVDNCGKMRLLVGQEGVNVYIMSFIIKLIKGLLASVIAISLLCQQHLKIRAF